ncbi:MAG: hypothetical protein ACLR6J_08925 [Parabacteroides merdae]
MKREQERIENQLVAVEKSLSAAGHSSVWRLIQKGQRNLKRNRFRPWQKDGSRKREQTKRGQNQSSKSPEKRSGPQRTPSPVITSNYLYNIQNIKEA